MYQCVEELDSEEDFTDVTGVGDNCEKWAACTPTAKLNAAETEDSRTE